jgi:hypothetical protein
MSMTLTPPSGESGDSRIDAGVHDGDDYAAAVAVGVGLEEGVNLAGGEGELRPVGLAGNQQAGAAATNDNAGQGR